MLSYADSAASRGLQVIIAGAGGAAHLPGMVASATPLPVIGVPVPLKHLDGMDSLLSIVQMPAGIPVATVSVAGARNAGLLAVRILGASDEALREKMRDFQVDLERMVTEKDSKLRYTHRPSRIAPLGRHLGPGPGRRPPAEPACPDRPTRRKGLAATDPAVVRCDQAGTAPHRGL